MGSDNDHSIVADDEKASQIKVEMADNRLAPAQAMSEDEFSSIEKKLKRKLDLRLATMVWLIFVLNYLDRVCLAPTHSLMPTLG